MALSERATSAFDTGSGKAILGVSLAFAVTSTISLVLRFIGKRFKRTRLSSEDWFIIVAQACLYGLAVLCILQTSIGGAGNKATEWPYASHSTRISKSPTALKLLISIQCLFAASVASIKISICLFYNRIFPSKQFRIASWITIGLASAWAIGYITFVLVSCRPLAYFWNPNIAGGTCVKDRTTPFMVIGALDALVDIVILILPLHMLYKLNVRIPDKVALIIIFGTGICIAAISIVRMHTLTRVSRYTNAPALILTIIEPSLGMTVACVPLTRPLFRGIFPRPLRTGRGVDEYDGGNAGGGFGRLASWELPSFVDRNLWRGRAMGFGREEEFVTTLVLESGTWSDAGEGRTRDLNSNSRGGG
ncbi:hypothetical protein BU24DRAFT_466858 [Aaosphaeria arxii CBS 175.79]|uniref:Rhodopsin domain-containing protein n=1 Tax=Aaosphaeria arxii CBS 175.79 TaxID=1450172 RepID=A0A6A5XEA9_9PLEO|nr:uncharacterized protein BU24DRAFT_466858 [Aaosphaeria arxii CBS 175.79]KAF2011127.1 hypothetical protein BU24DRAFT_466858 [Aaosphaeria arxii CBS 175.79]